MDLKRRLQLYLFGLVIGAILAYLFMGERLTNMKWTPEERIKLRLKSTLVKSTAEAQQAMLAWPTDLDAVKKSIPAADVLVKNTERNGDSLFYVLEGELSDRPARMVFLVFSDVMSDTTATLWELGSRSDP